jgi:hypothetical protein
LRHIAERFTPDGGSQHDIKAYSATAGILARSDDALISTYPLTTSVYEGSLGYMISSAMLQNHFPFHIIVFVINEPLYSIYPVIGAVVLEFPDVFSVSRP